VAQFDRKAVRILLFYAVALLFSFLARFVWHTSDTPRQVLTADGMYLHLISALGPFLGALLIWGLFRPKREISFGGSWPTMGAAMLLVPALLLTLLGIDNRLGIERHLFGAHVGIWIALYALLEETGWRGYLQGEFADRPALLRYVIVGLFWYAWHFSFVTDFSLANQAVSLGFILLSSIAIGFVADRTGSIQAAAAFHIAGNILATTALFRLLIPAAQTRLGIVAACFVVWLVMLRLWRMRDLRRAARADGETASG
jgi:membrane protease YdiL (CAAX protease family)